MLNIYLVLLDIPWRPKKIPVVVKEEDKVRSFEKWTESQLSLHWWVLIYKVEEEVHQVTCIGSRYFPGYCLDLLRVW